MSKRTVTVVTGLWTKEGGLVSTVEKVKLVEGPDGYLRLDPDPAVKADPPPVQAEPGPEGSDLLDLARQAVRRGLLRWEEIISGHHYANVPGAGGTSYRVAVGPAWVTVWELSPGASGRALASGPQDGLWAVAREQYLNRCGEARAAEAFRRLLETKKEGV